MMIEEVLVAGYKAIPPDNPVRIKLGRTLTLLVGPNASGKTAFIEALHNALSMRTIKISSSYKALGKPIIVMYTRKKSDMTYLIRYVAETLEEHEEHKDVTLKPLCYICKGKDINKENIRQLIIDENNLCITVNQSPLTGNDIRPWRKSNIACSYDSLLFPIDISQRISILEDITLTHGITNDAIERVTKFVKNLGYTELKVRRSTILPSNERGIDRQGETPKPKVRIELYDDKVGEWIPLSESAAGAQAIIGILYALECGYKLMLIDVVEEGLHPALQMRLIDEILSSNIQTIMTTYSETVFYYVFKLMKERKEDVKIYLFYRDEKGIHAEEVGLEAKLSEKASKALREFGAVGLFNESAMLALETLSG